MTVGSGLYLNPGETNQFKIVTAVRQLMEGRSNAVFTFTLNANSTSTTITPITGGPNSILLWAPATPAAAATVTTLFYTQSTSTSSSVLGTFLLQHASNPSATQTFYYATIG